MNKPYLLESTWETWLLPIHPDFMSWKTLFYHLDGSLKDGNIAKIVTGISRKNNYALHSIGDCVCLLSRIEMKRAWYV